MIPSPRKFENFYGLIDSSNEQGLERAILIFIHHHWNRNLALLAEGGCTHIGQPRITFKIGIRRGKCIHGLLELFHIAYCRGIGF
jgi:hypothetical protein